MTSFFVGIAGPSGSGKTTLCRKLKERYADIEHIRLDDYFKSPKSFPKKFGFKNWEVPTNIKSRVLLRHLKQLQAGRIVHTQTFPKRPGERRYPVVLRPKKIVLVEGFLLFTYADIRNFLDLKIFLDIPARMMLKRRAARFGAAHVGEYDTKVAIPEFLRIGTGQKKKADMVVDATQPQARIMKQVVACIKESCSRRV